MYTRGIVTDNDINIFMPLTTIPRDGKSWYEFSWRNFDNLKFSCNSDRWTALAIKNLIGSDRDEYNKISFKNADFSDSKLIGLDIPGFYTDFTGARFVGTDLTNTLLRGDLTDAVFDFKSLSSARHIGLENNQRFQILHNEQLVYVTPETLVAEVTKAYKKSFFGGGKGIDELRSMVYGRTEVQFLLHMVKWIGSGSDLEKAWNKALDKMAHEQGVSLQIEDAKPLQITGQSSAATSRFAFMPPPASASDAVLADTRIARLKEIYESNITGITGISLEKGKIFKADATFDSVMAALEKNSEGKTSGASYLTLQNDEVKEMRTTRVVSSSPK